MADYVELYIDQGADFIYILNLTDDLYNTEANIADYTFTAQMRRSYYSSNSVNLTCQITDAANGVLTISMGADETANIKSSRYLFDILATYSNTKTRLLEGIITVSPGVTR